MKKLQWLVAGEDISEDIIVSSWMTLGQKELHRLLSRLGKLRLALETINGDISLTLAMIGPATKHLPNFAIDKDGVMVAQGEVIASCVCQDQPTSSQDGKVSVLWSTTGKKMFGPWMNLLTP